MIQGPHHHSPVVCRTGPVALAAGQILLQGGPPQGITQLTSSSTPGQTGLHFSSPQAQQHHSQTPHPEAVQSYIACPGGGVVLGNQTVVLNGQQTLGGAAGHHAGQQSIGNLVLTMTVPQLVPTGALASGGQVLQAFTTVGSLASTGPLPPPTVTLAHSATHGSGVGGPINSQPLLSVHPSISTPPVGVSAPVVVNSSVAESTTSTPGISIPFGWKRLLSTSGSIVYVSPSSTQLTSLDHVKDYLQTQGTCKCGLECPLKFETVFNFDPKVPSKPWSEVSAGPLVAAAHDLGKPCTHKRKIAQATAVESAAGGGGPLAHQRTPSSTTAPGTSDLRVKKDIPGVSTSSKRKKRKAGSPYEGASVPQVFATKDQQGGVIGGCGLIQTFPRPLLQPHRLNVNPSLGNTAVSSGPIVSESSSTVLHSQVQFQQNQRPVAQLWNANERDSPTPVRTPILPVLPTSSFGPALVPVSSSNMQSSTSSPSSTTPAVNFHLTGSVGYGAGGILVHSGSNGFTPGGSVSSGYGLQGMSVVGGRIMFGEDIPKGQPLNPETLLKVQQHFPPGARLVPDEGCKVPRNLQHHHFVPNGIVAAPSLEAFRPQIPQGQLVVDSIGVRTFQTQPSISIPATIPHSSAIQAQTFDRASALHQQQWEDVCKRKKGNSPNFVSSNVTSKVKRTKYNALERESSPCPNVDVRQIPMEHRLPPPNVSGSYTIITARNSAPSPSTPLAQPHSTGVTTVMGVPSFMEDPEAYLAQQTALLNSTISRQTGGNVMFGGDILSPSSGRQSTTPHANPQALETNHSGLISSSTVGIMPLPSGTITTKASGAHGHTAPIPTSCALPKSCSNAQMTALMNTVSSATVDGHAIQSFISTSPSLGGCHQTITTVSTTTSTPVSVCQSQVTGATVKSQNIIYQTQNSKPNAQVHHQQLILRQPSNEFATDQIGASKDQRVQQTSNNNINTTGPLNANSSISNNNNPHQLSENQFLQVSSPNQIHQHILQTGSNFSVISNQGRQQLIAQHNQSPDDNPVTSSTFLEKTVCQQKDVNIDSQHLHVSRSQSLSQSNLPSQLKVQQMPIMEQGALQVYSQQQPTHFIQSSQNQHQVPDSRGPIQGGTVSTSQTSVASQGGGKSEDSVGSSDRGSVMIDGYSVAQVGGHPVLQQETSVPSSTQLACQTLDGSIYITSTSSSGSSNGCDQKVISVSSTKNNVGQYSQSPSVVTTMASGHTVSSNTITSVQAGKAPTITVSGGNTSTSTPPVSSPASHYSFSNIPTTQAFVTASSSSNSKSPLEMVQSVVSSIQLPCNQPQGLDLGGSLVHPQQISMGQPAILKTSPTGLPPGHFLVSNGNGQFIVASATGGGTTSGASHNGGQSQIVKFHPPSSSATSIPLVATQPVMQLVNALPVGGGPPQLHLLQHHPQQQNQHCHSDIHQMTVGLPVDGSAPRTVHAAELVGATIQQPHLQPQVISPGISKRKGKKRKPSPQTVASMLHIATQQQQGQLPVSHHHAQQQVVVPGPTTSYGAPGGMLQAVAFVPGGGKFLMNQFASASSGGAPTNTSTPTAAYGAIGQQVGQIGGPPQHLLTTASSSQALHTAGVNLLQPLSLGGTPGTATLLQNFPFQQLIGTGATVVAAVPGIQGMVMSALPDGTLVPTGATTSNPDASSQGLPPLQLHLQNLNGQNVLTQVQPAHAQNIFGQVNPHQQHTLQPHPQQAQQSHHHQLVATGTGGMVIRGHTPSALSNSQHHHIDSKIVQQQAQPVLSQGQFLVNGGTTGNPGTLIPHGPTLQGNHQITVNQSGSGDSFVSSGGAVLRPNGEFLQCSGNVLVPISQPQQQQQHHPRQTLHTAPSPLPHGTTIPSTHQARAQMHGSQQNTTVVQQNTTTIVQQQTMMVSNNHSSHHQQAHPCHSQSTPQQQPAIVTNYGTPNEIDSSLLNQPNVILEGGGGMTVPLLHHYAGIRQTLPANAPITISPNHPSAAILLRHSVSTQTAVNQSVQATSPPVYVTTVQSSNHGLLSASTCYVPSTAPPVSRPPLLSFGDAVPQTATVQSSSELIRGNSIMASAGSPPDTTTHSATASPADTTTSDVASSLQTSISSTSAASTCLVTGSTEGFAPSVTPIPNQSSCGVSPTRSMVAEAQCSVHFVSSSEPEPSSGLMSVGINPSPEREQEEGGEVEKGRNNIHSGMRSGPEHNVSNSSPPHDSAVSGSATVTSGFVPLGVCGDDLEGGEGGLGLTRVSDKDAPGRVMARGGMDRYIGRVSERPPPVESTVVVALGYTATGVHSGALLNEGKGAMRDVGGRDVVFVTSGDHVDGGKLCTSSADVRLIDDRGIKGYRRKHSDTLVMEGHSEGHADADKEEVVK